VRIGVGRETEIQKAILDYLKLTGVFCWRSNNAPIYDRRRGCYRAHNGIKGLPDICGILADGRFLGIEVKTEAGKLSLEQAEFQDKALGLGAVVFTARSIADVKRLLGLGAKAVIEIGESNA